MATAELLIFLHDAMPELERWQLEERLRMLPGMFTVQLGGEQPRAHAGLRHRPDPSE